MNRFAHFSSGPGHAIRPRLDALGPSRRLDPYPSRPIVGAYLEGRPVILAQPDPRTRRPGMPADLTVPLTTGRFRRAIDVERGRASATYTPTPIDYFPPITYAFGQTDKPPKQRHKWAYVLGGGVLGAGFGALYGRGAPALGAAAAVGAAGTYLLVTGLERTVGYWAR